VVVTVQRIAGANAEKIVDAIVVKTVLVIVPKTADVTVQRIVHQRTSLLQLLLVLTNKKPTEQFAVQTADVIVQRIAAVIAPKIADVIVQKTADVIVQKIKELKWMPR
jgi:hypothetical protein